ncbi:MAG TPA: EamA family transporter [Bryobacteraceae bacterium]|nr:EamA family transporter [Bryobacteraceae bacterium]
MTWLLVWITIVTTVVSDLLQSYEMKRAGQQSMDARGIRRLLGEIVRRRYLILSIVCLGISFFAFMRLLQTAPLSFAVPASAGSFVLDTVLARFLLREKVGARRAAGSLLVTAGIVLLAHGV